MLIKNDRRTLNSHTKRYVEEVFMQSLQNAGFVCPDERYLCWYRFSGEEIVNSVIFYSSFTRFPLFLSIAYGMYPLFCKEPFITNVNQSCRVYGFEGFREQILVEDRPLSNMRYTLYSDNIHIMAPDLDGKGLYTLDGIVLQQMQDVNTIESCYQRHKKVHLDINYEDWSVKFSNISPLYIDEAIYLGDTEVYPYCIQRVNKFIDTCKREVIKKPDNIRVIADLQDWELRKAALQDNNRTAYLALLEERKHKNTLRLKKKLAY